VKLLLIEDPNRLPSPLSTGLRDAGYSVDGTFDRDVGLWLAMSIDYDLVVLDQTGSTSGGNTFLRRLRKERSTRVLVLITKEALADLVPGPDEYADEFLVEPFAFGELLAQVLVLCRCSSPRKDPRVSVGPLEIDLGKKTVRCGDKAVPLTPREFLLLECLATRRGELVTRSQIQEHLYDERAEPASNAIDSAICLLRRKIGHPLIQTRHGLGYILP
jgi:DNA-binding response OmpR family regulator